MSANLLYRDLAGFATRHQPAHAVGEHGDTVFCVIAKCILVTHAL
jgi:hypothetical protein